MLAWVLNHDAVGLEWFNSAVCSSKYFPKKSWLALFRSARWLLCKIINVATHSAQIIKIGVTINMSTGLPLASHFIGDVSNVKSFRNGCEEIRSIMSRINACSVIATVLTSTTTRYAVRVMRVST